MKKYLIIIVILLVSNYLCAQTDMEEFEQYAQQQQEQFQNYKMLQDSTFIQYKEEIEKKWNEFLESTQKEWVSYSSDFNGRSQVDFEEGDVKVEAVVENDNNKGDSEEKAKKIVKKQFKKILQEEDETGEPILKDQVEVEGVGVVKKENIDEAAEKVVKKGKVSITRGKDNKKRTSFIIALNLVPNHLQVRVGKYKPYVEKMCKRFNIKPAFALGIIHTESFYNPRAYNRHGNAYGMMQIVPKYAGATMNYVLYGKRGKPGSSFLYKPQNNLAMGIGYMRWLADNKWSEVKNKVNQNYCIVCSYNGGPGSVYKAMTGKMKHISEQEWNNMIEELNTMDNNRLYRKLRKDIPWAETRKYIKLVNDRINKYYKNL